MSDQVGNHNVGFLMTRLKYCYDHTCIITSVGTSNVMMTGDNNAFFIEIMSNFNKGDKNSFEDHMIKQNISHVVII